MYKLVLRVPNGLGHLKDLFESHVYSQGIAVIEKCCDTAQNVQLLLTSLLMIIDVTGSSCLCVCFAWHSYQIRQLGKAIIWRRSRLYHCFGQSIIHLYILWFVYVMSRLAVGL